MLSFLTPDDIAECIMVLLSRNKIYSGKKIHASFIVNNVAGCFTNNKKSQKYKALFNSVYKEYKYFPSCALSYENGELKVGATRGNGIVGENITENIKSIKGILLLNTISNASFPL